MPLPTAYLMPLTAAFLLVAVAGLGFRARNRRGYRPMLLGLTASSVILFGKFSSDSRAVMYAGLSMLIAASLWNTWPIRSAPQCPQCAPDGSQLIQLKQEKSNERE
jgi:hypothetical protein